VLSVRLAQERPHYYERYLRGEYTSVTAAAIAAGLMKDDAHLRRAKARPPASLNLSQPTWATDEVFCVRNRIINKGGSTA